MSEAHSLARTRPKGSQVRKKFRQRIADAFELTRVSSFANRCLRGFPLFCKSPAASISIRLPLASWLSFRLASSVALARFLQLAARLRNSFWRVSGPRTFDPSAAGEHYERKTTPGSGFAVTRVKRSVAALVLGETNLAPRSPRLRFERSARN